MLYEGGIDVNVRNSPGWTPLHLAAHAGYFDIAVLLLNSGANPDAVPADNSTPLHYAAQSGQEYFKIVQELLEKWANPDAKDTSGLTPLHKAVKRQSFEVVKRLLESGADTSTPDNLGFVPLYYAKEGDVARLLRGDKLCYPWPVSSDDFYFCLSC